MTMTTSEIEGIEFHSQLWELPPDQRAWLSSVVADPKKEFGIDGKLSVKHNIKEHRSTITASSSDLLDAVIRAYDKKYPSEWAGR